MLRCWHTDHCCCRLSSVANLKWTNNHCMLLFKPLTFVVLYQSDANLFQQFPYISPKSWMSSSIHDMLVQMTCTKQANFQRSFQSRRPAGDQARKTAHWCFCSFKAVSMESVRGHHTVLLSAIYTHTHTHIILYLSWMVQDTLGHIAAAQHHILPPSFLSSLDVLIHRSPISSRLNHVMSSQSQRDSRRLPAPPECLPHLNSPSEIQEKLEAAFADAPNETIPTSLHDLVRLGKEILWKVEAKLETRTTFSQTLIN